MKSSASSRQSLNGSAVTTQSCRRAVEAVVDAAERRAELPEVAPRSRRCARAAAAVEVVPDRERQVLLAFGDGRVLEVPGEERLGEDVLRGPGSAGCPRGTRRRCRKWLSTPRSCGTPCADTSHTAELKPAAVSAVDVLLRVARGVSAGSGSPGLKPS